MIHVLAVLIGLVQSPPNVDEMHALAKEGPDSVLVDQVRHRPDDVRELLRRLLASAAGDASDSVRVASLATAERLAGAYAVAWHDSFLLRQVTRFQGLSRPDREAKVAADSIRRAGNAALGTAGIEAAMRAWRESLRRFEALVDTAGIAAALGNLGAGFYLAQEYDSAQAYLARSRDVAERIGDQRTAGNAVGTLASLAKDRGELRRASELYARASEIREHTGDARGLAADQNNLGLVAQALGDLPTARRAFEAALAANRRADRAEPAATNLVNLGNLASLEADYSEAAARYREALATYRAGPLAEEIAARRDLATARAATGDLQGARVELQRAEARATGPAAGRDEAPLAGLALARADLALEFNRLAEAERQYARAERLSHSTGDDVTRAAAQQGIGLVLLMRESYPRAQAALELALRAQERSADRRAAALTRLLIGYVQRQRGDTAAARPVLLQALDTLRALGDAAGEAAALGALGDLETRAGLPLTAESLYHRGLARLGEHAAPGIAWQLHAGLGQALRSRGALAQAAAELRGAVEELERMAGGLPLEERRAAFLADKWDVYIELALVERARGQPEAAFEVSERLRARQMLDLLARGRVAVAGDPSREPAAREQDLRRRIGELTRRLEASENSAPELRGPALDGTAAGATREALARAQDAYGELLVELREAQPEYAAFVRGEVARAGDVMHALAPDEALLEYLVGDSTTLVFVATADSVAALDLNVRRSTLVPLVDFARGTLASPTEGAARRAWPAPLRRLYAMLVGPVEASGLLSGKHTLLIAPHAELHYLPFAALVAPGTPERYLVERYVLEYVPSASVWLRLRGRAHTQRDGVLAVAPRAAALPGSQAEVAAIGRIFGGRARVLVGAEGSERVFRTLAPEQGIVHLATYGVLNKHNPLFSFVELGAGGGEDGRLEVHEVFGLKLNARLLVLSACQTGLASGALADVPAGDDWVGLVQAFLFSGVENVVATLWPVQDLASARFMERFYQGLGRGETEADALAKAQRATLQDSRTAQPFYWAGYALTGANEVR